MPFAGIPASILVGKLKKSKSGKKYGKALDVTIPPLAAGAISFFEVTIKKSKYIQARCKSKKMYFQARRSSTTARARGQLLQEVQAEEEVAMPIASSLEGAGSGRGGREAAPSR